MSRDIQIKVMVSPEEYVAFRTLADEQGQSQSGLARQLIKRAIRDYAEAATAGHASATDEPGQD